MSSPSPEAVALTPVPDFIAKLGLALPVTLEDVQEAYRQRAKVAHPDAGGDQQQFIELQQAYERAKEYASFRAGRVHWLAASVERYTQQEALVTDIQERGGQVETQRISWLEQSIGEDFAQVLDQIVGLRLRGPQIDDSTIDFLVERRNLLTALHWLDLSESRLTDAGLLRLKHFNSLRTLFVRKTQITSTGLQVVDHLPHLRNLYLDGATTNWWGRYRLKRAHPHVHVTL